LNTFSTEIEATKLHKERRRYYPDNTMEFLGNRCISMVYASDFKHRHAKPGIACDALLSCRPDQPGISHKDNFTRSEVILVPMQAYLLPVTQEKILLKKMYLIHGTKDLLKGGKKP
jgi:hypothetical protein